ncbi:MAG: hypothetical protein U0587_18055 [Candidatus Binatia bacterium]
MSARRIALDGIAVGLPGLAENMAQIGAGRPPAASRQDASSLLDIVTRNDSLTMRARVVDAEQRRAGFVRCPRSVGRGIRARRLRRQPHLAGTGRR